MFPNILSFSQTALAEIQEMGTTVEKLLNYSIEMFEKKTKEHLDEINCNLIFTINRNSKLNITPLFLLDFFPKLQRQYLFHDLLHNEQKTLDLFYNETERILKDIDIMIEYLFIDDGSKDNSLKIIHKLADTDKRIHYISFSRNFGKEAAIYAGLKNAAGDYITILDADLQDPPSLVI